MHKYPVLHVSFKEITGDNAKKKNFESAIDTLKTCIGNLALQHKYLLDSDDLDETDKTCYKQISTLAVDSIEPKFLMSTSILRDSLRTLSELMRKCYNTPTVILIDEYDVPLNKAYKGGYYDDFINIYRSLLGSALKENTNMTFAVITGCLKISKESIFTGLNHLSVMDVTEYGMDEFFGFSDDEVSTMLEYYGLSSLHKEVKEFYDGYRFGNSLVYNPWSVNEFVKKVLEAQASKAPIVFKCEWVNTSGNDILNLLLENASDGDDAEDVADDIATLENGGTIAKKAYDAIDVRQYVYKLRWNMDCDATYGLFNKRKESWKRQLPAKNSQRGDHEIP